MGTTSVTAARRGGPHSNLFDLCEVIASALLPDGKLEKMAQTILFMRARLRLVCWSNQTTCKKYK